MSSLRKIICLCFLFVSSIAWGYTLPCPGEFGLSAEWLYMQPAYDQPYFGGTAVDADSDRVSVLSKRCPVENHFHSGYRIDLIYSFCNCLNDVRLRWTHFPSFSDTTTLRGDGVFGDVFFLIRDGDQVSQKNTFDFYYLDLLLGWKTIDCCPFLLTLQGGLQYTHLRLEEDAKQFLDVVNATDVSQDLLLFQSANNKSKFWGVGPELGADLNYRFWDCFSLTTRTYGSLLIGKRNARSFQDFRDFSSEQIIEATIKDKDYWYVIPFANARLGLSYSRPFDLTCLSDCLGCINFDIEIGYEANWLFNSINRIHTISQVMLPNGASSDIEPIDIRDDLMSFSLHGPYIHVGFTF